MRIPRLHSGQAGSVLPIAVKKSQMAMAKKAKSMGNLNLPGLS